MREREHQRAVIVASGGPPPGATEHHYILDIVTDEDLLVAANGGTSILMALGLQPDAIVGDLDSLSAADRDRLTGSPFDKLFRYPREKDKTDSQLAIEFAASVDGIREIVVCGAFGDRFDHGLALTLYASVLTRDTDLVITLTDGAQTVFGVKDEAQLRGRPGDIVSLIPLTGTVTDVHIEGFKYPLSGSDLSWGQTLGVSNELTGTTGQISVRGDGMLLVVHRTRDAV